nr:MAG TPA: hypothetical protein [Caudoviricetes sp.]
MPTNFYRCSLQQIKNPATGAAGFYFLYIS